MARYIDAERLKMTLASGVRVYDGMCRTEDVFHTINNEPTADVVEVVRCRICKHGHWEQETCHGKCVHYCDLTDLQIDKDHFCSYGERRGTE
jgi:hypothetical protein